MSWEETCRQLHDRHLLTKEAYLPSSDPLVKANQLEVNIKAKETSMDFFIDDIITITIDDPCWVERAKLQPYWSYTSYFYRCIPINH